MLNYAGSKETKILNTVCIMLVLFSGVARLLLYGTEITHNIIIYAFYSTAAFIWISQIRRRVLQPEVRRNLIAAAYLMVFWMGLRTVKYMFLLRGHFTERYAWYLYYIPQTFCVLLMFFSVLYIGRPYDRPISRLWKLLYIPAIIITAGILTNDMHQLAFRFPEGMINSSDTPYIHGPFYFAALLWIFVLFTAILAIVLIRCAVPGRRRKVWISLVPLGVGICYLVMFFVDPDNILQFMFRVPEMVCVIFAAFMEGLIATHLLPSNDGYGDFWNASSIGAGIMDKDGVIRYRSEQNVSPSPEQILEAQEHEVLLKDGNVSLRSHPVQGGYGYWTRDISEINHLNRELEELGDVLAEENAMLDAENKLAESRFRIEQQNKLYDSITESVRLQIDRLSSLLDGLSSEEEQFEQTMKFACILNAYIKRHSNLLLLCHQGREIHGEELHLAIAESLEYVRLYGIKTYGSYRVKGTLPGESILTAYELVEAVLEAGIPGTDAVLVNLNISEDVLALRMELNNPRKVLSNRSIQDKIEKLHGTLEIEMDQQTEYVSLVLPLGGEWL